MAAAMTHWPRIDYAEHPAFKSQGARSNPSVDAAVSSRLADVHAALGARLRSGMSLSSEAFDSWFNGEIQSRLADLEEVTSSGLGAENLLGSAASKAWRLTAADVRAEALFHNGRTQRNRRFVETPATQPLLSGNIHVAEFDDRTIRDLNDGLKQHQTILESRDDMARGHRYWRSLPLDGAWWEALNDALDRHGFYAAASAYFGVKMVVGSTNLVYSSENELWWKNCYADVGIEQSEAAYFHHDQDFSQIKSVIYLSETGPDQGAFSYIENGTGFREANILPHFYFHVGNGMNNLARNLDASPRAYFRPGFQNADVRAAFARLPKPLQGSTHFGDDLEKGSVADAFLHGEKRITSDQGNAVLFNGGDIFHRGGMVRRGKRWTLQLMFEPERPLKERAMRKAKAVARSSIGNVIGWERYATLRRQ